MSAPLLEEVTDSGHPPWCSADECYVTLGTRVHQQALTRWEDTTAEVAIEMRLLDPDDDPQVYLELGLRDLRCRWSSYFGLLPLEVARRLRDQLTAHLDAVR